MFDIITASLYSSNYKGTRVYEKIFMHVLTVTIITLVANELFVLILMNSSNLSEHQICHTIELHIVVLFWIISPSLDVA